MKFSELPVSSRFVVIRPAEESQVLVKDSNGEIRKFSDYLLLENSGVTPDTEIQQIFFKK